MGNVAVSEDERGLWSRRLLCLLCIRVKPYDQAMTFAAPQALASLRQLAFSRSRAPISSLELLPPHDRPLALDRGALQRIDHLVHGIRRHFHEREAIADLDR